MLTFLKDSPFPFYCERCGLVEANTALNVPVCPSSGAHRSCSTAAPPVSVLHPNERPVLEGPWSFGACATENLCPACKKMTLVFHEPSVFFD